MSSDYRNKLFKSYNKTHGAYLDSDDQSMLVWSFRYAKKNYLKHIEKYDRNSSKILEIGCNKGYLLSALNSFGFKKLYGVDLSPDDVQKAKDIVPGAAVDCIDARDYLRNNKGQFDIIVLKAVLEHVSKNECISFLEEVKEGLVPDGIAIIDVPNMDWVFASHERYMDFTHEVGFTRESLAQIMRNVFAKVDIIKGRSVGSFTMRSRLAAFVRPVLIQLFTLSFMIVGEGASEVWWNNRSIIGIGQDE
ncbi:MAG: class I SAM-dependent methyltransferase [Thermodesulfobacteriota bacterium]